jgi:hypothetical protein
MERPLPKRCGSLQEDGSAATAELYPATLVFPAAVTPEGSNLRDSRQDAKPPRLSIEGACSSTIHPRVNQGRIWKCDKFHRLRAFASLRENLKDILRVKSAISDTHPHLSLEGGYYETLSDPEQTGAHHPR